MYFQISSFLRGHRRRHNLKCQYADSNRQSPLPAGAIAKVRHAGGRHLSSFLDILQRRCNCPDAECQVRCYTGYSRRHTAGRSRPASYLLQNLTIERSGPDLLLVYSSLKRALPCRLGSEKAAVTLTYLFRMQSQYWLGSDIRHELDGRRLSLSIRYAFKAMPI